MRIESMRPEHSKQVLAIYRLGIAGGNATFETAAPTWAKFNASRLPGHRLVALGSEGGETDGRTDQVLGWAAVSRVSDRAAYAGVVEHSVYVHPDAQGHGVGFALLTALLESTEAGGIWTVQSGIFPENTASLALHQRAGFRVIGTRERIGRLNGEWRNVVLVERRSPVVI
ncbi:GNAT family N-acetyltransferase [Kitasatospora sp. NPDC006697]|uniref:GNAT family N-acetyltransferase n=1 Tax=Kitasatospora sp. NPDC006697 TaxID=3364020 RepID=UPI0036834EB6